MKFKLYPTLLTLCVFSLFLFTGCSKDDDSTVSASYAGSYKGTADTYIGGEFAMTQNPVIIEFGKGSSSGELTVGFNTLQIKQDKVTLSGNKATLPRKLVTNYGTPIYEHGDGTFNGNKLTFDYYLTTEGTDSEGNKFELVTKYECDLTRQN